ncbi:MAG: hypothetical protein WB791_01845 [Waddliaceae bacterium]
MIEAFEGSCRPILLTFSRKLMRHSSGVNKGKVLLWTLLGKRVVIVRDSIVPASSAT